MTLRECEDKLLALADEAMAIYREYNPTGTDLNISIYKNRVNIEDGFRDENDRMLSRLENFDAACSLDVMRCSNGEIARTDYWRKAYGDMAVKK